MCDGPPERNSHTTDVSLLAGPPEPAAAAAARAPSRPESVNPPSPRLPAVRKLRRVIPAPLRLRAEVGKLSIGFLLVNARSWTHETRRYPYLKRLRPAR